MARYIVRKGFCVHFGEQKFPEGTELELSIEDFNKVAHQVEPVKVTNSKEVK